MLPVVGLVVVRGSPAVRRDAGSRPSVPADNGWMLSGTRLRAGRRRRVVVETVGSEPVSG